MHIQKNTNFSATPVSSRRAAHSTRPSNLGSKDSVPFGMTNRSRINGFVGFIIRILCFARSTDILVSSSSYSLLQCLCCSVCVAVSDVILHTIIGDF